MTEGLPKSTEHLGVVTRVTCAWIQSRTAITRESVRKPRHQYSRWDTTAYVSESPESSPIYYIKFQFQNNLRPKYTTITSLMLVAVRAIYLVVWPKVIETVRNRSKQVIETR